MPNDGVYVAWLRFKACRTNRLEPQAEFSKFMKSLNLLECKVQASGI